MTRLPATLPAMHESVLSLQSLLRGEILSLPTSPTLKTRKRRRGEVANPANTLDGLVAQRMHGGESIGSRCLAETEAIESPDDVIETKRMEKDPDVCTRTCSTCGYQGKWVSEMIRHKRVHTNERPFKCKYCSRTSKWKADLIRHVAKTHGIRVVSKYSRSKTFDSSLIDERKSSVAYKCVRCNFEQSGLSVVVRHLSDSHSLSPYECPCGTGFTRVEDAMAHARDQPSCSLSNIKFNLTTVYSKSENPSPLSIDIEDISKEERMPAVPVVSSPLFPSSPLAASAAPSLSSPQSLTALLALNSLLFLGLPSAFTPTPTSMDCLNSLRLLQMDSISC